MFILVFKQAMSSSDLIGFFLSDPNLPKKGFVLSDPLKLDLQGNTDSSNFRAFNC